MPIHYDELLNFIAELCDERNLKAAVTGSLKGGITAGVSTAVGGLLFGPAGLLIGGTVGGVIASLTSKGTFKPVGQIIRELPSSKKKALVQRLKNAFKDLGPGDLVVLLSLLQTPSLQELAIREYESKIKKSEEEKLQEEIARLRKEGAKLVQDEIRLIQEEINKELQNASKVAEDGSQYKIKVEWKAEEDDETNGGYNSENLERIFRKYGDITVLVVSPKCKGQALVEFKEKQAAELAMKIELGLMQNPIKLKGRLLHFRRVKSSLPSKHSLFYFSNYISLWDATRSLIVIFLVNDFDSSVNFILSHSSHSPHLPYTMLHGHMKAT